MPPDSLPPDPGAAPPLEYGHARPRFRRKPLVKPLLILLCVVLLVGGTLAVSWRLKLLSTQQRMLDYAPSPQTVAYEEDPGESARLLKSPGYRRGMLKKSSAYLEPPEWEPYRAAFGRGDNGYLLFAHERTHPSGGRRLLMVFLYTQRFEEDHTTLTFGSVSVVPATFVGDAADRMVVTGTLNMHLADDDEVRFFSGQVHVSDASKFTIDCDVNGKRNVIDGVLTRLDSIELTPRSGTALRAGLASHWYPDGSKLPVPAKPPRPPMPPMPPGLEKLFSPPQ